MATVAQIIDRCRLYLDDGNQGRWSDAAYLVAMQDAVERVSHIAVRNNLYSALQATDVVCAGVDYFDVPADFLVDFGLYRVADMTKLTKRSVDDWETITSASPSTNYIVLSDRISIKGSPGTDALRLYYWPKVSVTATTDNMPWEDRLNVIIQDYLCMRLRNIDEMSQEMDTQMLKDLEAAVLNTFVAQSPVSVQSTGWMGS